MKIVCCTPTVGAAIRPNLERVIESVASFGWPHIVQIQAAPPSKLALRDNYIDAWTNCLERLSYERGRSWLLNVEDDAAFAPGFSSKVFDLLDNLYGHFDIVSFYRNDEADLRAMDRGLNWRRLAPSGFYGTVCCAASPNAAKLIVERWRDWPNEKVGLAIGDIAKRKNWNIAVSTPSLVQHLDCASTVGHDRNRRRSRSFRAAFGDIEA